MYQDEIDDLKNLPVFEDVYSIDQDEDYFYLLLKPDKKRVNLFMCVECLTQSEFNKVAHQIVKKLKNPCEAQNEC